MLDSTALSVIQAQRRMDDNAVCHAARISPVTMTRASHGLPVNNKTLQDICGALKCDPGKLIKKHFAEAYESTGNIREA